MSRQPRLLSTGDKTQNDVGKPSSQSSSDETPLNPEPTPDIKQKQHAASIATKETQKNPDPTATKSTGSLKSEMKDEIDVLNKEEAEVRNFAIRNA